MKHPPHFRRQRGVTLIIALIMLAALALLSVWGLNTGTTNLRVVGHTQARQEALAAAQVAVESTISSPMFIQQAAAVASSPVEVDVDQNGTADYTANLTPAPACYRVRVLKVSELDPGSDSDINCLGSSSAQNAGIHKVGAASKTGDSLCADSDWNIRAEVTDSRTQTSVAVNQGVSVRSLSTDTQNSCP